MLEGVLRVIHDTAPAVMTLGTSLPSDPLQIGPDTAVAC